ncbi:hypothetical protein KM043_002884 [Ampulex compressa]|nr:hypothetical protein KM043_002884 [Ampulex compressa]
MLAFSSDVFPTLLGKILSRKIHGKWDRPSSDKGDMDSAYGIGLLTRPCRFARSLHNDAGPYHPASGYLNPAIAVCS